MTAGEANRHRHEENFGLSHLLPEKRKKAAPFPAPPPNSAINSRN